MRLKKQTFLSGDIVLKLKSDNFQYFINSVDRKYPPRVETTRMREKAKQLDHRVCVCMSEGEGNRGICHQLVAFPVSR